MKFDIVTIFPKMVEGPLAEGIVSRGIASGLLDVKVHDLRTFTTDRHRVVEQGSKGELGRAKGVDRTPEFGVDDGDAVCKRLKRLAGHGAEHQL